MPANTARAASMTASSRCWAAARAAPAIREMAEAEQAHLDAFDTLLVERRVRPTALAPVWHVAGFALGAASALLGERAAMACTVAVEEVIEAHYEGQAGKPRRRRGRAAPDPRGVRRRRGPPPRHRPRPRGRAGPRLRAALRRGQARHQARHLALRADLASREFRRALLHEGGAAFGIVGAGEAGRSPGPRRAPHRRRLAPLRASSAIMRLLARMESGALAAMAVQ